MNKVILMGRLVNDPESRMSSTGKAMTKFKVAVNRQGKQQEGQAKADFFFVHSWGSTAEFVAKHFKKGQQILIEGFLRNNQWSDSKGEKHYQDDIHADQVYFADTKRETSQENYYNLNPDDEEMPF